MHPSPRRASPRASRALAGLGVIASVAIAPACLRRDVADQEPSTKISFDAVIQQPSIDKVDVLVMVDDSSSMADKQRILARALPDLVRSLVQPRCVDAATGAPTGALADPSKPEGGQCPTGTEPPFAPITDMHLAVMSSSLGGLGADVCSGKDGERKDDRGRLLARGPEGPVAAAGDLHFLAWYPDVPSNVDKRRHPEPPVPKTRSLADLERGVRDLVVGVGQDGCGLEAQLESVYRFLAQPDPWTRIDTSSGRATYGAAGEIDAELLRQRAAFLRPDSLVAVIMLTDEDDSSVDPLAMQGTAFRFGDVAPMPRATSACGSEPASEACTSCAFGGASAADPSCAKGGGVYTPEEDDLNVRFHRMKQRFGVDPQFPVSRYVDALSRATVPRRELEHDAAGRYAPRATCTNPLFAARLPSGPGDELCDLPRGQRTPDRVLFAIIGGVPSGLAGDTSTPEAWTRILGRDPARWDEAGIDPHMIPSTSPRASLPAPSSPDDADAIHGREWATGGRDMQYACTFDLHDEQADGSMAPAVRTCDEASRRRGACDCDGVKDTPLCSPSDLRVQVKGKAYPTRRPLWVARELGQRAVVASLCPVQLTAPDRDDFGYRPAVRAISERLIETLTASCLPRPLERDPEGLVACKVMAVLPDPGSEADCARSGLTAGGAELVETLRERLVAEEGPAARALPICELPQVAAPRGGTCRRDEARPAFCYVEAPPGARGCTYSLAFSRPAAGLAGVRFRLQCIQTSAAPPTPVPPGN